MKNKMIEITLENLSKETVIDLIELIRSHPQPVSPGLLRLRDALVKGLQFGEQHLKEIEEKNRACAETIKKGCECHYTNEPVDACAESEPSLPPRGELVGGVAARVQCVNQSLKVVDESLGGIIEAVQGYESSSRRD